MDKKIIGAKLKELRGERTLSEVSKSVGISTSALGMYETGRRIPQDEVKIALAEYFNTTVDALFYAR